VALVLEPASAWQGSGLMGRAIPDPRPAGGPLPKPAARNRRKPPMPSSKVNGRRPAPPPPRQGRNECCPMVAAVGAARRGKFRLARRYAVWSVRLLASPARF